MWGCVCVSMKNSLGGDKFDITVTDGELFIAVQHLVLQISLDNTAQSPLLLFEGHENGTECTFAFSILE